MKEVGEMDWNTLRRIVTGHGRDHRSVVLIDGGPAKTLAVEEAGLAEIWEASLTRGALMAPEDRLAATDVKLEPSTGAMKVRWFTVPAEDPGKTAAEREAAAAFGFAAAGAAHARKNTVRHPMMHETETLDVIVLVRGSVDLLLDDAEAQSLKPGDVVIQRGTNHAWVNRGTETALLVAILVDGSAA